MQSFTYDHKFTGKGMLEKEEDYLFLITLKKKPASYKSVDDLWGLII